MNPLLKLTGLSKSFGGVRALVDVSFDLCPDEVHALVGENGAGKSTLVKMITGAHQPDAGTIEFFRTDGGRARSAARKRSGDCGDLSAARAVS